MSDGSGELTFEAVTEESPLKVEDLLGKDADDEDGLLRFSRPLRNAFTTRICNAKEESSKVMKSKANNRSSTGGEKKLKKMKYLVKVESLIK